MSDEGLHRFLTASEAAEVIGCTIGKLQEAKAEGRIPYMLGRPHLFERIDVDTFKAARDAPGAPAEIKADARAWARQQLFRRRLRSGYFDK